MGSTIVTNRCAAVFDNPHNRGDHIWVLFEKCHESNVYPHTPRWSARAIGRTREALQMIFQDAACCEGGMLQDRSGQITPETYIRRWIRALRHPRQMPEVHITLKRKDLRNDFRLPGDPSDEAAWEDFCTRMRELGREDIPLALEGDSEVMFSLHQDIELVLAIYGYGQQRRPLLGPWRALGGSWAPEGEPKASIGYFPAGGEISSPVEPVAYRIDDNELVMVEDGKWRAAGWDYSVVGDYVKGLWEQELRAPGSYEVLIPPYRKAIHAAQLLPRGSEAEVDLTNCPSHAKSDVLTLARELGGRIESDPLTSADAKAWIPWSVEAGRKLAYLPHKATTWHVPEAPATEVARLCA